MLSERTVRQQDKSLTINKLLSLVPHPFVSAVKVFQWLLSVHHFAGGLGRGSSHWTVLVVQRSNRISFKISMWFVSGQWEQGRGRKKQSVARTVSTHFSVDTTLLLPFYLFDECAKRCCDVLDFLTKTSRLYSSLSFECLQLVRSQCSLSRPAVSDPPPSFSDAIIVHTLQNAIKVKSLLLLEADDFLVRHGPVSLTS